MEPEATQPSAPVLPGSAVRLSRRGALGGSLAGLAVMGAGRAIAAPTRTRLPLQVFSADPARVASLRRAVYAMRRLPPSDPQSWWWQGAVHHLDAAGVPDFPSDKPQPSQADQDRYWRQCPHGLKEEGAYEFLGWHAAYLLHFETVLRAQSGDDSLALPYWDYTDPAQRQLPIIFRLPKVRVNANWEDDPAGEERDNPLYERLRAWQMEQGAGLSRRSVDIDWFSRVEDFAGLIAGGDGGFGFGGGLRPGQKGQLEIVPHGQVHTLVGGTVDGRDGLMVNPPTAAFDPVFWVHHANIDRLWRRWLCTGARTWGAFGSQAELDRWMGKPAWPFKIAADAPEILQPRGTYMRPSALPYVYEGEFLGCPDPVLPSGTSTKGLGSNAISRMVRAFEPVSEVAVLPADLIVTGGAPVTVTLPLAPVMEIGAPRAVTSVLKASAAIRPFRLFLEMSGLELQAVGAFGYDIFVNLPPGGTTERRSPHFVGVLDLFGTVDRPGADHHHPPLPQSFDVSARALADSGADLRMTVVPFALADGAPPDNAAAARLVVRRVSVTLARGTLLPSP